MREDPPGFAVALPGRVEESAPVQAEVGQVPADGAHRDRAPVGGQFEGDATCRPLLLASQLLDPGDHLGRGGGGLAVRHAGAIEQAQLAELPVAAHPFARAGAGDAHFGGDVGDRTGLAALDEAAASLDGQWGARGGARTGSSCRRMGDLAVLILPSEDPSPCVSPSVCRCLQRHGPQHLGVKDGGAKAEFVDAHCIGCSRGNLASALHAPRIDRRRWAGGQTRQPDTNRHRGDRPSAWYGTADLPKISDGCDGDHNVGRDVVA
ncbi:hypothetical protein EBESD8_61680 [Rhodococcus aetherivorans]|nr:hypothetical protein EBESD8_61680 [Rhodococcus aetherivorans]